MPLYEPTIICFTYQFATDRFKVEILLKFLLNVIICRIPLLTFQLSALAGS